ncbi:NAD(P)-dependent oxidoreductase [Anaerobacillus isosaccharinicus]|uniref:SDR family oxidoreductase n=1 Tax=Anaerobacillus isosaccharinicus TaxID=1532552 RepID=A0A1S2LC08_9BACI|nr:NAD(P)-binding oxidoreductase [Anaerobacillus isosaccharinicus]MBA5584877.1 SDR family oxidoreductase [Anaerobacillus isosaccharinicus]QOY36762.1 SDR family oxidoreductase [Anaerobacillus isosaccharinicus]
MRVLVLGASGATGKQVVRQLIKKQINTRVLIRKTAVLPKDVEENPLVEILKGNINELDDYEMKHLLRECNVIISCLGHNVTPKGMFGKPRYLVFDTIKRVSELAKNKADEKIKLILMSTTGYTNILSGETKSIGEKIIDSFLKLLLPPHRDNLKAANYLITEIGEKDETIEWVLVRPDTLVNHDEVSSYEICELPTRSPIFNAGKTSRINVSHFMTELVTVDKTWKDWQFKTPVVYNKIDE